MGYESTDIRNVAFTGHSGSGKTTLLDGVAFLAKLNDRMGSVDNGSSFLDFEPEELKRGSTISSSFIYLPWNKKALNLIDTPGDSNFFMDGRSCIQAVDAIVIVIDATTGIRLQTEKAWELAKNFNYPVIFFISKIDKDRANPDNIISEINKMFEIRPAPLQLPIGLESNFKGLIDLIANEAHNYMGEFGNYSKSEIDSSLKDNAKKKRDELIESIAESNDKLMEKYLETGELTKEEITMGLTSAVKTRNIFPVVFGSAKNGFGIKELLDYINDLFPSPLERANIKLNSFDSVDVIEQKVDCKGPLVSFVFKTIVDPFAGRLNIARVLSGEISIDSQIYNSKKKTKERVANIFKLIGKKQENIDRAIAGDIVAFPKLKETQTQDTFVDLSLSKCYYKMLDIPCGFISYAVKPKTRADEDKIGLSIAKIMEEDQTITTSRDEQTSELLVTGMGQVHIEATLDKMKRKYGVSIDIETPKVPYKETIKGTTEVQGKYKKQSGGKGQYGDTWLKLEPLPRGKGFEFVNKIFGGSIPRQYIPAVEKGIIEAMVQGVMAGYPTTDIRITLYDGSYHDVDSSEMAFKIAGSMGFKKGILLCTPTLLEPIMNVEVIIPEEYMGDIIGDLNSRRGKVLGMEAKGSEQVIKAQVPMAEVLTYMNELTSMTSGRGYFTMGFDHYEEVPSQISAKIVEKRKQEQSRE